MDFLVESAAQTAEELNFGENIAGQANIKVIGCGGAGNNMVSWLYKKGIKGAEILACNTDQQHLNITEADKKFLIGADITRGLGCGGFPEKGAEAAQESLQEFKGSLKDSDMVFVCAGMGGGTGTGSAPIAVPSLVNLDYADVKAIMQDGGVAAIGVGASDTNNRVEEAVKGALSNPLLDISYQGATGALIHIAGGPDMTLDEINKIGELVTESLDEDANVIWGARVLDDMKGKLTVMTIMTGVKSPWILGKVDYSKKTPQEELLGEELGIEIVH